MNEASQQAKLAVGGVALAGLAAWAVKVRRDYFLDRHYVVRDGEIVIVDEFRLYSDRSKCFFYLKNLRFEK